jgi:hypothetical protein
MTPEEILDCKAGAFVVVPIDGELRVATVQGSADEGKYAIITVSPKIMPAGEEPMLLRVVESKELTPAALYSSDGDPILHHLHPGAKDPRRKR